MSSHSASKRVFGVQSVASQQANSLRRFHDVGFGDGIAMSVGWTPNARLIFQAGGRFQYAGHVEQLVPHTLPNGLSAAGRVNGIFDPEDQINDGNRAGLAGVLSGETNSPRILCRNHPGRCFALTIRNPRSC